MLSRRCYLPGYSYSRKPKNWKIYWIDLQQLQKTIIFPHKFFQKWGCKSNNTKQPHQKTKNKKNKFWFEMENCRQSQTILPCFWHLSSMHQRKFFKLHLNLEWPHWTKKVKCSLIAVTRREYYYVGIRPKVWPPLTSIWIMTHLVYNVFSCNLISEDCTLKKCIWNSE